MVFGVLLLKVLRYIYFNINQRALQLYERLGFTIQKRSKIWPINKIIDWPFNETILMEQTIG